MVAVKTQSAERFLAAPPEGVRLFLIYGSDAGAISERVRLIERIALQRGGGDLVIRIGSDELSARPGRIADEVYAASLFGGEPVIALRVLDGRHNVIGALLPLFERPPDAAWLIVEAAELSSTSPLRKAFESSREAASVPSYPPDADDVTALVTSAVKDAGLTIEPAALDLLSENLGGDRLAIRGELEKLFLYLGDQTIVTFDAVEAIVGDTTEGKTDHAIDAALLGDHEALELSLSRLRAEHASPQALGVLTLRHLFQLQMLRSTVDAGEKPSRAIENARPPIFNRRRPAVEAEVQRWPSDAIAEARGRLDRAIMLMRTQSALEESAISEALHAIALDARRLKQRSRG